MKFLRKQVVFILIPGLLCLTDSITFARNRNNRHPKRETAAAAALLGAGAGGGLAGALGGAKWAPLGIFGGAAAGYFLIRALQNNRNSTINQTREMSTRRHVRSQGQTVK